jgi:septal ring factor EnvC (AmiA/AmiB activator)
LRIFEGDMMIKYEQLIEEKSTLQADFDKLNKNINQVTNDLGQMKANLNALNGAIQQTNKLIKLCQPKKPKAKEEALKEVLS